MAKEASPKLDALRAMREANAVQAEKASVAPKKAAQVKPKAGKKAG